MPLRTVSETILEIVKSEQINITAEDIYKVLVEGFKASFTLDESRQVKFRIQICCKSHDTCFNLNFPSGHLFMKLNIDFSANELRKLSQAVDFKESSIVVDFKNRKSKIVGLFSGCADWPKFLLFEEEFALLPSFALTFSFNKPGSCTVYFGISKLIEIFLPDTDVIEQPPEKKFDLVDSDAHQEFCKIFSQSERSLSPKVISACFNKFLSSLIIRSMLCNHGGTILVAGCTKQVEESLRLKYGSFRKQNLLNGREFFNRYFELLENKQTAVLAKEKLLSYTRFLGNLTNVDGALVLTNDFSISGFGAEILIKPEPKSFSCPFLAEHGMRHRSAYYFVEEVPNSLAIVMSQDGGNKIIYKSSGKVKMIKDYEKDRLDFLI